MHTIWGTPFKVLLMNDGAWSSSLKSARSPFDRQEEERAG